MKNKGFLIFGIILSVVSILLLLLGASSNMTLFIISLAGVLVGIYILIRWSTDSFQWICEECGERFEITLKQNVLGMNSGVNCKRLYCPKCHRKTMCKGVLKR